MGGPGERMFNWIIILEEEETSIYGTGIGYLLDQITFPPGNGTLFKPGAMIHIPTIPQLHSNSYRTIKWIKKDDST